MCHFTRTREALSVNPEWTDEMITVARPAEKVLPKIFGVRKAAALLKSRGKPGSPEVAVADPEVRAFQRGLLRSVKEMRADKRAKKIRVKVSR